LALPVIAVAADQGPIAGLVGAGAAAGANVLWTAVAGLEIDALLVVTCAVGYGLIAVTVGVLSQRLVVASRRLEAVFDTTLDPFFVFRAVRDDGGAIVDFRCEYLNNAGSAVLPAGRGVGATMTEIWPDFSTSQRHAAYRRLVEGGDPLEYVHRLGDRVLEIRAVRLGDGFAAASRDVTAHTLAEERLRNAGVELERSNAALTEFAHVVSHELIGPLASAMFVADTAGLQLREGRDASPLLARLRETLEVMADRVAAVLRLAEVRTGAGDVEDVDCGAVVAAVVQRLEPLVATTGARVDARGLPVVRADRDQLGVVFENLLTNALRYRRNGERPEVTVRARRDDRRWRFSVADRGIGIAPDQAERIFELFTRAAGEKRAGTGIGLAISREIVRAHGGEIWVESEPGVGSAFHFTLPAAPVSGP
jgi:signal transduction histidine kinase